MPRFAADLTLMFRELPLHERLAAVAEAGFRAVQLPLPYDQDLAQLRHGLDRHHLEMVVIDLPRLEDAAGDGEMASHPDRVAAFRNGIALAVDHARELGCARVNCLLAAPPAGLPVVLARATLVANLGYAATMLAAAGIRFLIEPAGGAADFEALRAEIGNPNLSLYVDCSHAGDSLRSLERVDASHRPCADQRGARLG